MPRPKRLLTLAVVASLLGSSIAWAVTLWLAPLGAYEVTLHMDDGRFAIVLDRRAPTDRAPRVDDPAMNDGDGLHDEYVVTLAALDACSTPASGSSVNTCGLAVVATRTVDVRSPETLLPRAVTSRAGPLAPASFTVLRI